MNLRLALFDLARNGRLDPAATRRLQHLAGFDREPNHLGRTLPRGLAVLGAALAGFGILLWIAANWPTLGRGTRFALLQAVVLAAGLGAWRLPRARAALGLVTLLAIGALLAFFGQTYQTGADAWQLFALWAALAVPLCLGVRGDTVWAPWVVVAMTGVSLWTWTHGVGRWGGSSDGGTTVHAAGWSLAVAVVLAMAPAGRRFTGAGPWAMRTAATLAVGGIAASALVGLFGMDLGPRYPLGLVVLLLAAVLFTRRAWHDLFALSATALGLDALLVGGLARLLFREGDADPVGAFLLLGLVAAGVLALSVHLVMRVARAHGQAESAR